MNFMTFFYEFLKNITFLSWFALLDYIVKLHRSSFINKTCLNCLIFVFNIKIFAKMLVFHFKYIINIKDYMGKYK